MDDHIKHKMALINTMLLEMASGNFHYRIARSERNDTIEALVVTLNMLAEEIQDTIVHQGYANRDTANLDIVQMSFIIDNKGIIQMVNSQACKILSMVMEDIVGSSFDSLLVDTAVDKWKKVFKRIKQKTMLDTVIDLSFRTNLNLMIPKTAYLTRFKDTTTKEMITLITIVHNSNYQNKRHSDLIEKIRQDRNENEMSLEKSPLGKLKPKVRLSFEDIRKIRQARDLLINHPEYDFPPLKDFALQIGTNEFKLKYGFKELYGTTVHNFLTQERLRKAQMMVQYSDLSFKSIADMTGYKSLAHFSRSFKKRYGFSPSELRKNSLSREQ